MRKDRVLVVDDDTIIHAVYQRVLANERYDIEAVTTGHECLARLGSEVFDIVLLDIRMPDLDGIEVLRRIRESDDPDVAVIIVTGKGTLDSAIDALRLGANDYITKPFGADQLVAAVTRELEATKLKRELRYMRAERRLAHGLDSIVTGSAQMQQVLSTVAKVAASPVSGVLIQGETGTGKRLIAEAIHYNSTRAEQRFVQVNCTAIPESLVEVELLGSEKGAFTDATERRVGHIETADGGTLFFDEIGHMPLSIQPKLLNIIEERTFRRVGATEDMPVDVRIIAATNRNLQEAIEKGEFRRDLYYRLDIIPIHVPPLREREGDVTVLARHFLDEYNKEFGKEIKGLSPAAMAVLAAHDWPGNVRELRNVIERAVLLASGDTILPGDLVLGPPATGSAGEGASVRAGDLSLEQVERLHILDVLRRVGGNKTRAAEILGVSTETLRRRLKEWNSTPER